MSIPYDADFCVLGISMCSMPHFFQEHRSSSPTDLEDDAINTSSNQLHNNLPSKLSQTAHVSGDQDYRSMDLNQTVLSASSPSNVSEFDMETIDDFEKDTFSIETSPPCILHSSTTRDDLTERYLQLNVQKVYESKKTNTPQETNKSYPDSSALSNSDSSVEFPSQSCSPLCIEEETDEVVTTFHYDSDDSDHTSQLSTSTPQNEVKPVSPWHDKNRKIRINPLRVLKMKQASSDVEVSLDIQCTDRARMISPDVVAAEKASDKLKRSRSCGLIDGARDVSSTSQEPLCLIMETTNDNTSY